MLHKTKIEDLALFGGSPAFVEPVVVGRPYAGNRASFLRRVNDLLDRRRFTNNGPFVQELECSIARMLGVEHCIAVCNATLGLQISMQALGLSGEVILPSFTFVATAHAVQNLGITPVFCDIDPATHKLDPERVRELITPRTTGILGVHLWGRSCDVYALQQIADQHGLKLLFDAAHALGCSYEGRMIGSFGNAEVFSFHATKYFNTFEGGAVVTNDAALAAKLRLMINFGFAGYDTVVELGINGKMSEICAAMGLTGLEALDELIEMNYQRYQQYEHCLKYVPGVRFVKYDETERQNYQYVAVEVDAGTFGVTRDQVVQLVWAENVLARRYFYPGCHRMEPYRSLFPRVGERLAHTERVARDVLVLPSGDALTLNEIKLVCDLLLLITEHHREIHETFERGPRNADERQPASGARA